MYRDFNPTVATGSWDRMRALSNALEFLKHIVLHAVLPSNSLVNYSSFIMACVILVDFLLDGHSVPAAHSAAILTCIDYMKYACI